MPITITITADTAADARHELEELLGRPEMAFTVNAEIQPTAGFASPLTADAADVQVAADVQAPADPVPAAEPPKRTRKKAEAKAVVEPAVEPPTEEAVEPEVEPEVEETIEPEVEETTEADAADEPAPEPDVVESFKVDGKWTHDSVRNALMTYAEKFAMSSAQQDGPKALAVVFPGAGIEKISNIPDDQTALEKAVRGFVEMTQKNPYKRTPV